MSMWSLYTLGDHSPVRSTWALAGRFPRMAAAALYLHVGSLGSVLISWFWSLINERFIEFFGDARFEQPSNDRHQDSVRRHAHRQLATARDQIAGFLETLRLRLHPTKNTIFPVAGGIRLRQVSRRDRVFGSPAR